METARAKAAVEYINHGLQVIPIKPWDDYKEPAVTHGLKDCTDNPEQVEVWWGYGHHKAKKPDYNVGIVCGEVSGGLIVIDIDRHGVDGMETLREFELAHGKLPDTVTAITGSDGRHMYYRTNRSLHPFANPKLGIDLRAEGSYVVAPPSIHKNGNSYEWSVSLDDEEIAWANDTVYALIDFAHPNGANNSIEEKDSKARFKLPDKPLKEGEGRDNMIFKYAASLRSHNRPEEEILNACIGVNATLCDPPLPLTEVKKKVKSAMNYDPMDTAVPEENGKPLRQPKRGRGNKIEFFSMGDIIIEDDHACLIDGLLNVWNGNCWKADESTINMRSRLRAKDCSSNTLNEVYKYIIDMAPRKYANSSFDNGYYAQFANGVTIDMATGREVEPTPDMLIRGTLNVDWNPNVGPNEADTFFDNLSTGRDDIKTVMLEVLGCCMLSRKPVKRSIMCIGRSNERDGNAANGKSSFIDLIGNILGAENTASLTLQQLSRNFMTSLLFGKMANLGDDIPSSFVDEAAASDFKRIITGETITADVKNKPQVKFQPNLTMVFSMNEIPRWSSMGGIERRLLFLPFFGHFTPESPNHIKDLKAVLGKEEVKQRAAYLAAQVLPTLIERGQYTHVPEMDDELAAVMRDNNAIERWLFAEDVYVLDITGKLNSGAYGMYKAWAQDNGEHAVSSTQFARDLKKHIWTDANGQSWRVDNPRGAKGKQFYQPVLIS